MKIEIFICFVIGASILFIASLFPSKDKEAKAVETKSPYYMSEEKVGRSLTRAENYEAVCYKYAGEAISCFPKQKKNL